MWGGVAFVLSFFGVIYAIKKNNIGAVMAVLLILSLFNIPILRLGNSASAGFFAADLILIFVFVKYFFSRRFLDLYENDRSVLYFYLIASYAVLRGVLSIVLPGYSEYINFFFYGVFKWICFFVVYKVSKTIDRNSFFVFIEAVGFALIPYYILAILNQVGMVELNGLEASGYYEHIKYEYLMEDASRSFIGNNPATVGFVSFCGIMLSGLIFKYCNNMLGILVFLLGFASLLGSGSRTDIGTGFISILICTVIFGNKLLLGVLSNRRMIFFGISGVFVLTPIILNSNLYAIERLLGTDLFGEASGSSDGTLAYRIDNWIIALDYALDNFNIFWFGFGPNGYRIFSESGIGSMGFGHNVYVNIFGEYGFIGLVLFLVWLASLFHSQVVASKNEDIFVADVASFSMGILIQRLMAGVTVDSMFAVDNMLATNVFALVLLSVGSWATAKKINF